MVFLVEEKVFRAAYSNLLTSFISNAHQLDSIKVLLLMTEAVNAAMVTHALLVADAAKDFFQVHLASFGGRPDGCFVFKGNVLWVLESQGSKHAFKKNVSSEVLLLKNQPKEEDVSNLFPSVDL